MKRYLFIWIISIGIVLTLTGCSNIRDNDIPHTDISTPVNANINTGENEDGDTGEDNAINTTQNKDVNISENKEVDGSMYEGSNDFNKKYASYTDLINTYMTNFKNLYIDVITMEENISIITGKMDIDSTEGNKATKYVDPKGNVIRYNLDISGETGKTIIDYYVLDATKLYVVELHKTYSSPMLGIGGSDILCYDIKKYIVDGNEVYYLDDVTKSIVATNQKEANIFMTLDELNSKFKKTNNK